MDTVQETNANLKKRIGGERNYQIDFLKLVLSGLIFICHTYSFANPNDVREWTFFTVLGWAGVMAFFMISGFLMISSIDKRKFDIDNAGKESIRFVINKFKVLALPYWIAGAMYLLCFVIYYIYSGGVINGIKASNPLDLILNIIPEAFCITNTGGLFYAGNNSQTWYIAAMLLMMIPIVFLLIRKRDMFTYVLAPLIAIISLGWLKNTINYIVTDDGNSRLIRACCGLCFGVLAWTMYKKMANISDKRSIRIAVTITEAVLYLIFFVTIFTCSQNPDVMFSVLLLLPIALAITFSGKSYISYLFKAKWLKCLSSISLYIYLNHALAVNIVRAAFLEKGYIFCAFLAAIFTVVISVVCYIGVRIVKFFIKKIRKVNEA